VKARDQRIDDLIKQIDSLRKEQVEQEKRYLRKDNAANVLMMD
jgi:hypothetical protein